MSVTPRGMSVQEAYRLYRDNKLLVNRRYQRKLVWSVAEKRRLIGSILKSYPIPLLLLAERPDLHGVGAYEIIDGMQRLNAIVSFIENDFAFEDKYFAVSELPRAKQLLDAGVFKEAPSERPRLTRAECADILDYQLAITIFPASTEAEITEIFGRVNSGGRQLSNQERRQAGVSTQFADAVRKISAELRGDVSRQILPLTEMPEISIELVNPARQGPSRGVPAETTIWCRQGILSTSQLRDSEDEELVADIVASVVRGEPVPASREYFDALYSAESEQIDAALIAYGAERAAYEIKATFSVLRETIEKCSSDRNFLRKTVNPGSGNPIKTAFIAIFLAFFELVVQRKSHPDRFNEIFDALQGLQRKLEVTAHYATTENRIKNINQVRGLVEKYFVRREPPSLGQGHELAFDFENSLRRSRIETSRYECKQGLLRLDSARSYDDGLINRIVETICGIANVGPEADGYVFVGVADDESAARRVKELDNVEPVVVGERFVVGVDREAAVLRISLEQYVSRLVGGIRASRLSEPLKTQVLSKLEIITFRGLSTIRITVPAQRDISFVGDDAFIRVVSGTEKVSGPKMLALSRAFSAV